MREELAHRDRRGGGAERVGAGRGVERLEHRNVRQLGQVFVGAVVEREPARLDELHRGDGGDGLGHRRDCERWRPSPSARPRAGLGQAERALVNHAVAIARDDDHAGHILALDGGAQRLIQGGLSRTDVRNDKRCGHERRETARPRHEAQSFTTLVVAI